MLSKHACQKIWWILPVFLLNTCVISPHTFPFLTTPFSSQLLPYPSREFVPLKSNVTTFALFQAFFLEDQANTYLESAMYKMKERMVI